MKHYKAISILFSVFVLSAWGPRGHQSANRAAVMAIPENGPVFLKQYVDWIARTGPVPDSWRGPSEPYSKIFEDPNHGWFKEQFAFLHSIPRSRYEFVLQLYDHYRQIKISAPQQASLTNVRWTGTLPYAAMENFDRMKSAMRRYRQLSAANDASAKAQAADLERDIAFYMGWMGHYTADGAQPLHDTIHHDGWQGPNPHHYTQDPHIHGRFESSFVDLIKITDADLRPRIALARVLTDPFVAILQHLDRASTHVEQVYRLDQKNALQDPNNAEASELVKQQLAEAAQLLRDLTYTAWVESAQLPHRAEGAENPINPQNPDYNPATGTAPPGLPVPSKSR